MGTDVVRGSFCGTTDSESTRKEETRTYELQTTDLDDYLQMWAQSRMQQQELLDARIALGR